MKVDFNNHQYRSQIIPQINADNFNVIALELFHYQYHHNKVYKSFVDALHILPESVTTIEAIPFLPISFFKTHDVISGDKQPKDAAFFFESSGTSNTINSKHFVFNPDIYKEAFINGFHQYFGRPEDYIILALLPSYLERQNSSLVYMMQALMKLSAHPANGCYLNEWSALAATIKDLKTKNRKVLLLGVTYALLDFAEAFPMSLENVIVVETGGMKGRKEEWTRNRVHEFLIEKWQLQNVQSEYGMTELLSQAYSFRHGVFHPASTMKVMVRDINDPLSHSFAGSGCLNIIDLANIESCAFIATEDVGIVQKDGCFEVLGRMDHAALRGCSLMTF